MPNPPRSGASPRRALPNGRFGVPDRLLDSAPLGIGSLDAELRWRWLNPALARIAEAELATLVGAPLADALPGLAPDELAAIRAAILSGETVVGVEVVTAATTTSPPSPASPASPSANGDGPPQADAASELPGIWRFSFYPRLLPDRSVEGADVVALEVTERRRVEERLAAVSGTAALLSGAVTSSEVITAILDRVVPLLGADAALVGLIEADGSRLRMAGVRGSDTAVVEGEVVDVAALPLARAALAKHKPVLVSSPARDTYPTSQGLDRGGARAAAAFPLRVGGTAHGVVVLTYRSGRVFLETDRIMFAAIGELCEQALERARLLEAERARHEADALLAFIVDSADDAILSIDLEGRVTSWNQGAVRIFGYRADEMLGRTLDRLIPPERQAEVERLEAALSRGERVTFGTTQRLARDGTLRDLSITVTPIRDKQGHVIGDARIERDLTNLVRAEQAQRAADERLRALIESSPNGVILTDEDGIIEFANTTSAEMFGYRQEELRGRTVDQLVPESLRAVHARHRGSYLVEPVMRPMGQGRDLSGRRKDGSVFALEIGLSSFASNGRRFVAVVLADISARRAAEVGLRESEARLAHAMSAARMVAWEWDLESGRMTWSNNAQDVVGFLPATVDEFAARLKEADAARFRTQVEEASRSGAELSAQFDLRNRTGEIVALEAHARVSVDGEDRSRMVGVLMDVTRRRQAEAELLRTTETFRALVGSSPLTTMLIDTEGRIVFANPAAEHLFGVSPEHVVGQSLAWNDGDPITSAIKRVARDATSLSGLESTWRRPTDGAALDVAVHAAPQLDPAGGVVGVVVQIADISERKRAAAEMRRVSETLAALVAASPVAIVLFDLDGTVRLWNRTAERVFGWREDEVLGRPNPAIPPHRRAEAAEFLARIAAGDTAVGYEDRWVNRDGKALQVAISAAPVRGADGWTVGIVGLIEDVTSRRALEEQLLQGQKMEGIGRLAGGVAHDFNNMLTAIRGFADLLTLELEPGSSQRESVDLIREAADRAAALTRQLLAFSRRQHLEPKVLDLNVIIHGIEPMLRRLIGEDVELAVATRPDAGRIVADPSQLEQVILNLVVNARDAMPGGGRLTIETAPVAFDGSYALEHYEVPPGRYIMLAVSDTGVGMDRETRLHVFEPFFTTKEPGKGTGLGLSTIYGIVRQSGGHIWLYSEPAKGTTFKLYFPISTEVAAAAEPVQPASAPARPDSGTVLLVEDEVAVRTLMTIVLDRQGYHLLVASGGEEALAIARSFPGTIELLVTDVVMAGMAGPEVARLLREARPEIATLLLSGYTEEVFASSGGLEAADGFLSKPFTPDVLAHKVREILTQRRTARRSTSRGSGIPAEGGPA